MSPASVPPRLSAPEGNLRSRWFAWGALPAIAVFGGLLLTHWQPSDDPAASLCFFRRFTHLACPGCGFTRALAAFARGELARAWALHPLAPLVLAEGVVLWLGATLAARRGKRWSWGGLLPPLLAGNLMVFLAVWVLRWASGTLPP